MGLSMTGEFEKKFSVYDGDQIEVKLKGNFYTYVKVSTKNMVPAALEDYMKLDGKMVAVFQLGDGEKNKHRNKSVPRHESIVIHFEPRFG